MDVVRTAARALVLIVIAAGMAGCCVPVRGWGHGPRGYSGHDWSQPGPGPAPMPSPRPGWNSPR